MVSNEPYLLITKVFTRQIEKNSQIRYTSRTDKIENITNILGRSQRIKVIPVKYYDFEIKDITIQKLLYPLKTEYHEHNDGCLSFRIEQYDRKIICSEEQSEEYLE